MMAGTLFAILVVLFLAASSYAATDFKSEVNTLINQYEAAWQSGDVNAVQACFTEDAIFMPPGRDAAKGREEILKMYTAMYQIADVHALDLKLEEYEYTFSADGDFAYLWGPYNSFHKDGSIFKLGKGMAVVKKVDGLFKLHVVNINHDDNPSSTQTKDPMQDEIDALTRFHEAAWRKGDYEGGASVYVESGVAMVPGMAPVRGKKEIARLFEAQMKMGVTNVKYEHQDVASTADGQMGYAWCYYTFFGKDGSVLDYGKGMIIAKRVDGEVKLIAGIFNQNSPSAHIPGFTQNQQSLEAELEVLRKEFVQAWGRQDSRGVAECFAKDGMLLSPGKDVVQGREEIAQVVDEFFQLGLVSLKLEAKEVIQSAHPHWFEWGYYTFLDKNGNDIFDHGKYMVIGTRENGKVKLYKDMFNSNTNPAVPGRHDEL